MEGNHIIQLVRAYKDFLWYGTLSHGSSHQLQVVVYESAKVYAIVRANVFTKGVWEVQATPGDTFREHVTPLVTKRLDTFWNTYL